MQGGVHDQPLGRLDGGQGGGLVGLQLHYFVVGGGVRIEVLRDVGQHRVGAAEDA